MANRIPIELGLDRLLIEQFSALKGLRVGLICNQASVDHGFQHAADLFYRHPEINLKALFGPQHGIRGDVQDNMVETGHTIDIQTKLPVYSLYSETREPTSAMLADLDAVVFDLQDVGCRVYTFIYTMANAMRSCARDGKKFFVCDRPNPINGLDFEGNLLEPGHESFVGMFPIPMRHGMTVGELAGLFNTEFGIGCDLEVFKMENWTRELYLDETDCPWVPPSPNMPTVETAAVFPGTVYFEGTEISEGRGTTRPFEMVGAPFIDGFRYAQALIELGLPGVYFRQISFKPTFQKHSGQVCGGVFVHVSDRKSFKPVLTGLALAKTAYEMYPEKFEYKKTPYEYEYDRNAFDVISGSEKTRGFIESGGKLTELEASWSSGIESFRDLRQKYLLY